MQNQNPEKTTLHTRAFSLLFILPVICLLTGYFLQWEKESFFVLTGLWLMAVPLFLYWLRMQSRKQIFWLVLTTLLFGGLAIMTGAWFETYTRFFVAAVCFFLLFVLNSRKHAMLLTQVSLFLYPSGAYLMLLAGSTMPGASPVFYPVIFLPVLCLLVYIPLLLLIRRDMLRLVLAAAITWLMAYHLYGWYLQVMLGEQTEAKDARYALHPLYDEEGALFRADSVFQGRVLVLDFWHSKCGACFKSFPDLQQLQRLYADDGEVMMATVNIPLKSDTAKQHLAMLQAYDFRQFMARGSTDDNEWSIEAYPTTLVFDKNGRERFRGLALYQPGPNYLPDIIEKLKTEN